MRDALFLLGLAVTFVVQLIEGANVIAQPGDSGAVNTIAILVTICFAVGISRAWELIGGPSIRIAQEVTQPVEGHKRDADAPAEKEPHSRSRTFRSWWRA